MFQSEPNTTKHRPEELKYLVRDIATDLINRYCEDEPEAIYQAGRLNNIFYPGLAPIYPTRQVEAPTPAEIKVGENMLLF